MAQATASTASRLTLSGDRLAARSSSFRTQWKGKSQSRIRTLASSATDASSNRHRVNGSARNLCTRRICDDDQVGGGQAFQQRNQVRLAFCGRDFVFREQCIERGLYRCRGLDQRPDACTDAVELVVDAILQM